MNCNICNKNYKNIKQHFKTKLHDANKIIYELNQMKYEDKKINFNCISYNINQGGNDKLHDFLYENLFDIIFIQEAKADIISKLSNKYNLNYVSSHCGKILLGINLKHQYTNISIYAGSYNDMKSEQFILNHCILNNKELLLVSCHLTPFKDNHEDRSESINEIIYIINKNNLNHLPLIIAGDTNMRTWEYEDTELIQYNLKEPYNTFYTWPNKNIKQFKNYNCEMRFDRVITKNINITKYKVNYSLLYSDHYPILFKIVL